MNRTMRIFKCLMVFSCFHIFGCNAGDWLISETLIDTSVLNTTDTVSIANSLGLDVDLANVTLYDYNCTNMVDTTVAQAITILNADTAPFNDSVFNYDIFIDMGLVNTSALVAFDTSDPSTGNSIGTIQFCTRVLSVLEVEDLPVSFRRTNFEFDFNMIDGAFSSITVTTVEDPNDVIQQDLANDYVVNVFECDNTYNQITPVVLAQNDDLVLCLQTSDPEVEIQNFAMRIESTEGYVYHPVSIGTETWSPDPLTVITVDPSGSGVVQIITKMVVGLFEGVNTEEAFTISGTAFLEFTQGVARKDEVVVEGFQHDVQVKPRCEEPTGIIGILLSIWAP